MESYYKDFYVKYLKAQMEKLLSELETIDKSITDSELYNEQFVLDFYDKLNEVSVRK